MISPSTFSPPAHNSFGSGATASRSVSSVLPHDKGLKQSESQAQTPETKDSSNGVSKTQELSDSDRRQVEELQTRDREVRAHEAAHKAAAGSLAQGAASFSYQQGPDGRRYAVGGEVSIDASPVDGDPQATLQKAQTIRAAALAPAQPSNADHAVAAKASQMAVSARAEMAAETQENTMEERKVKQGDDQNAFVQQRFGADAGASIYQQSINPAAPSELVGNNLNISV